MGEGFIHGHDHAAGIGDHDAFACVAEHTGRQLQRIFVLVTLRDVARHEYEVCGLALRISQQVGL